LYKNPSNTLLYLNTLPLFTLSSQAERPNAAASMASEGGRELLLVGKEMDAGGQDSQWRGEGSRIYQGCWMRILPVFFFFLAI